MKKKAEEKVEKAPKLGLVLPCLTTEQINAIEYPNTGTLVLDVSIDRMRYFNGRTWRAI